MNIKLINKIMFLKSRLFFVILFAFFICGPCFAQESIIPDLSSNYILKLIDTAKAHYPKVKSFQNHINIANSVVAQSKESIYNSVSLSYVYQPGVATVNPTSPATTYIKGLQIGVFVNLGTLLTQRYQVHQAKESLEIAKNDQDEYLIGLATEVKKRYYIYLQREAELKLQINIVQASESSFKDVKYKFEKGEATVDDLNKSQGDFFTHQSTKLLAETNLFIAKADLEELLGTKLENIK